MARKPECYVDTAAFIAFIDKSDSHARSTKLLKKYSDQKLTLADAHGLIVMSSRRFASCWSTDRHMSLTGASLVT